MHALAQIDSATSKLNGAASLVRAQKPAPRPDALEDEVLTLLRGLGTSVPVARGALIFEERGHANAIYRVLSGTVALWHARAKGRRHIVDFRLRGEFFGVVHRPEYTINAEAVSDAVVIAYRRGEIDDICDAIPSFRRSITVLLADPVTLRREAALAESQTARERIIDFLVEVSHRIAESGKVRLPIAERDIADRVDLPRDIVSRSLHDLANAGALTLSKGDELVVDAARLEAFA
jgi:CRP/FNR family transcriptional regulator, nitrogen fixation regulation protein